MDDGEEIPALNESWTFAGAKLTEWSAGMAMMIVCSELFNAARSMPLLITVMLCVTFSLAAVRRRFPDEERGAMHYFMNLAGMAPPDVPRQASIQPYWSGAPLRSLPEKTWFMRLGLDEVFRERQSQKQKEPQ